MLMPPKIRSGDIVRREWGGGMWPPRWREHDILQQVMHGEDTWDDNPDRRFSFNVCDSGIAEDVTEVYRLEKTDCGISYKLIWHRPPRGQMSEYSFLSICRKEVLIDELKRSIGNGDEDNSV